MSAFYEDWIDRGWLPDAAIRLGIRQLLAKRLLEAEAVDKRAWIAGLRHAPVALATREANAQHYEVPTEFFLHCLGPRRKYSCALYPTGNETLAEAEEQMLALTCERAQLADGETILELGCGWGSLSLWMAEKYPRSRIVAVSNSRTQKEFIDGEAKRRGLGNLEVRTANMVDFETSERFQRVVSVEMFEHMRNYAELLRRIAAWLEPGGTLFVHVFTHRSYTYPFVAEDAGDWMARHFFAGGQMPSEDLLLHFQDDLRLRDFWQVNGVHYQKTCEHWLHNLDRDPAKAAAWLGGRHWVRRWRVFFMACAELFGYRAGKEWGVCHYLFAK
ncbi:MAG: cyclopropane-fatty-acyl-phospholipid synthase family protein [Bryobacter sp.]|nr:cyclopropane-fatty-acyl-phospholipid synthase family protein [Bryobacter sp.]